MDIFINPAHQFSAEDWDQGKPSHKFESNIGRKIRDWFCNGFPDNRDANMDGAIIEAEGEDWMVARTDKGEAIYFNFNDEWKNKKQRLINEWCFPKLFDLQLFLVSLHRHIKEISDRHVTLVMSENQATEMTEDFLVYFSRVTYSSESHPSCGGIMVEREYEIVCYFHPSHVGGIQLNVFAMNGVTINL